MKDLSALEANLLYAVQQEPGRTLTYYGDQLRTQHTQMTRALERLLRFKYLDRNDNRLTISASFSTDKFDEEIEKEERRQAELAEKRESLKAKVPAPKPNPHQLDHTPPTQVNVATKAEVEKVVKKIKVDESKATLGDILTLLSDGGKRNALDIARHFGMKSGHSVGQLLRVLTSEGSVVKDGTLYYRQPADAMAEAFTTAKPAVVAPEPAPEYHMITEQDLRAEILAHLQPFTAQECFDNLSHKHNMLRELFDIVFEDVAASGALTAWDGQEFVDPRNDYSPDHRFVVLNIVEAKESFEILDSYVSKFAAPYRLYDVVCFTRLPASEVLSYFYDMGYGTNDPSRMIKINLPHYPNRKEKRKIALGTNDTSFKKLAELDSENIKRFLMGGVKTDVFLKRFNLDPAQRKEIIQALILTDIAKHDTENDWLILHPDATVNLKLDPADLVDLPAAEVPKIDVTKLHLTAPTGEEPRAWTEQETADLVKALKTVKAEEAAAKETPMDRMQRAAQRFEQSLGATDEKIGELPAGTSEQPIVFSGGGTYRMQRKLAERLAQNGVSLTVREIPDSPGSDLVEVSLKPPRSQPESIYDALDALQEGLVEAAATPPTTFMVDSEAAEELGLPPEMAGVWLEADNEPESEKKNTCRCGHDHGDQQPISEEEALERGVQQVREMEDRRIKEMVLKEMTIEANPTVDETDLLDNGADPELDCVCDCDFGESCGCCRDANDFNDDDGEAFDPEPDFRNDRVRLCSCHDKPKYDPYLDNQPKPKPQWGMVLQMLEERMRFEHQYTQANQLKEIREYLDNQ